MRSNGQVERAAQASMRVQKGERASLTRREMPSRGLCGDAMPGTRYSSHVHTLCNAFLVRSVQSASRVLTLNVRFVGVMSTGIVRGGQGLACLRRVSSAGSGSDTCTVH